MPPRSLLQDDSAPEIVYISPIEPAKGLDNWSLDVRVIDAPFNVLDSVVAEVYTPEGDRLVLEMVKRPVDDSRFSTTYQPSDAGFHLIRYRATDLKGNTSFASTAYSNGPPRLSASQALGLIRSIARAGTEVDIGSILFPLSQVWGSNE